VCVTSAKGAECSVSTDRIPECAPDAEHASDDFVFCWNNSAVYCKEGFPAPAHEVLPNPEDQIPTTCGAQTCVSAPFDQALKETRTFQQGCALCTDTPVIEPRCAPGVDSFCDGATVVACRCGYRLKSAMTCIEGASCVSTTSTEGAHAFCAFSAQPDPRCDPTNPSEYCDGTTAVGCEEGYARWRADCSSSACDPTSLYGTGCARNAAGARTPAGR
jgi:hypothetical protein